jgi:hypothetical protein
VSTAWAIVIGPQDYLEAFQNLQSLRVRRAARTGHGPEGAEPRLKERVSGLLSLRNDYDIRVLRPTPNILRTVERKRRYLPSFESPPVSSRQPPATLLPFRVVETDV